MKLAYQHFSTLLEFSEEQAGALVIENPSMLYQFLTDMKECMEGRENGVVWSEGNRLFELSKRAELLTDFIRFDWNQKSLLTRILSCMDKVAGNEAYYNETQQTLAQMEQLILKLATELSCDIRCEKLTMQNLLKSAGIVLEDNYSGLEERLLAYMELARDFMGKRLFILVNVRGLISAEKLQNMVDTAILREHAILFVDNKEYPRLRQEKRLVVDFDLCEI